MTYFFPDLDAKTGEHKCCGNVDYPHIKTKPDSLIPEATGNKHCKDNAFLCEEQIFKLKKLERHLDLIFFSYYRAFILLHIPVTSPNPYSRADPSMLSHIKRVNIREYRLRA